MGSGLDDIAFNTFKRVTSETFSENYAGNYFGRDFNGCTDVYLNLGMLAAWIMLACTAIAMQYKVTGKDLPFPRSPRAKFDVRYGLSGANRRRLEGGTHSMNEYSREERLLLGRGDSTGDMRAFARTQPSGASHDRVRTADGEAFLDGGARAAARREQRLQVERIRATREQ